MPARRVLVIEDEPGARDALGSLLGEDGYEVRTAGSGAAGLRFILEFRPDTVVCDFYLPDIDGLEVLRQARALAAPGVIFIVLTAGCGGAEAEKAVREEADFFLKKPIDLPKFRLLLQNQPERPVLALLPK
ncbi:MAG TPA: response regulator [Longimicrobiaceae bacterium]|nr:response regulator [Longimicrobiaceae bacterium]